MSVSWLGGIIIKQVYNNENMQSNLSRLTVSLCEKPSIRHNTAKSLTRIYSIKAVKNNTPVLLK